MNILVTGAYGFVGRNLIANLETIRDGKNQTRPGLRIDEIYCFGHENTVDELIDYCSSCDIVFHLAGINRASVSAEYQSGNVGLTQTLLEILKKRVSPCPVMFSSSIQASLSGRFSNSAYGESKRACEDLFFQYSAETGAEVFVYRLPNLVGKWIRPEYNSAVGTFCHHIANDIPINVSDRSVELELLFIEDLIDELYDLLDGKAHRCHYNDRYLPIPDEHGPYCYTPKTYHTTLGTIVDLLNDYKSQPATLILPTMPKESLEKKLYSVFLSYLPKDKVSYPLKMNHDERGSFTEILKTVCNGQFSVNITHPGATKGQHWHNSKWELFIVVSGHALIQQRRLGSSDIWEYEVSGKELHAVHMLPGFTHSITNLSKTEDLITLMWANEIFDPLKPDTYFEPV